MQERKRSWTSLEVEEIRRKASLESVTDLNEGQDMVTSGVGEIIQFLQDNRVAIAGIALVAAAPEGARLAVRVGDQVRTSKGVTLSYSRSSQMASHLKRRLAEAAAELDENPPFEGGGRG